MAARPDYRLTIELTDLTTGETVIADYVSLIGAIDQFGGNESIDHAVSRMLRQFKQTARVEYEAEHYQIEGAVA